MGVVFRLLIRRAAPFARHEDMEGEKSPKHVAIPPSDSILPMLHPSALRRLRGFLRHTTTIGRRGRSRASTCGLHSPRVSNGLPAEPLPRYPHPGNISLSSSRWVAGILIRMEKLEANQFDIGDERVAWEGLAAACTPPLRRLGAFLLVGFAYFAAVTTAVVLF